MGFLADLWQRSIISYALFCGSYSPQTSEIASASLTLDSFQDSEDSPSGFSTISGKTRVFRSWRLVLSSNFSSRATTRFMTSAWLVSIFLEIAVVSAEFFSAFALSSLFASSKALMRTSSFSTSARALFATRVTALMLAFRESRVCLKCFVSKASMAEKVTGEVGSGVSSSVRASDSGVESAIAGGSGV